MSKKISLIGRKRIGQLMHQGDPADLKRSELLSLKMDELNQAALKSGDFQEILLSHIRPDPNQPRKTFKELDALTDSVRIHGVIQPIIITRGMRDGFHQIIAGERRFHAAKRAGLERIPCILREESDLNVLYLQLLENDQREGVSPVEEAAAIAYLIESMKVPKLEIARELGRDSAWISMRLGLHSAPQIVKDVVQEGLIEDWRTLHELRKLADESPELAAELITRIRKNQLAGSYRTVISQMRKTHAKEKTGVATVRVREKRIQKMERQGDQLFIHMGTSHPVVYQLSDSVLEAFIKEL